ncbi:MAG: aminoacyl-tRNA hydrolase [Alphaproteobacteria bacterium]|nr:aminoacyl-tRNA hydrolase [Alphaproteobacteria bacterium]
MQENKPVLIVGLGNPGMKYDRTRHNAGFMAIDMLAQKYAMVPAAGFLDSLKFWRTNSDAGWKKEKNSLVIKAGKIILAKPQTFMNLSGKAVQALMTFYKIPLENLIVIHDDMDLPTGTVREKMGGGSAGHNGIKSIDAAVGKDYRRIRIGVGHPRDAGFLVDPSDWVLGRFSNEELEKINSAILKIEV